MITLIVMTAPLRAHEVMPSVLNLSASNGEMTIVIDINAEAMLASINLSEIADTDAAENAQDYDALRALSGQEIADRFGAYWPTFAENFTVLADGVPVAMEQSGVIVLPTENINVVRQSQIRMTGTYPVDADSFQIGWAPSYGTLIVRQNDVAQAPYTGTLTNGELSAPFLVNGGSAQSGAQVFASYIPIGFDHIVPKGLDHILFVLGLFFLAARMKPLLVQVSLFTVAHTITLALAALGYTAFIDDFFLGTFGIEFIAVVEPLIALSITYVAVENIYMKGLSPWRPYVIFGFGLLHGLGFASVLAEFGLPENAFIPALIGFNIGVEVGQLAVIAVMFLCVWQALRIDRGKNEVTQGFALYVVLFIAAIALMALNPAPLQTLTEGPVWVFAGPLAAVFALCAVSIRLRDRVDAYRHLVAVPASVAIATVGAYWFVERVFL
ncbi:HupE / UreJ protein [Yoonia tamlensis]|uniref:HupE / UreJ protein n=1 Tax=Yoonia tamlensis TaxID=390270 RepID=A0A1I6GBE4_9RHOB|nr:HupE/UreJ family protein [Yoonia tamlensis]SFR39524.1 HupE / UreJ protein [Yoonia tamlensis]